MDLQAVKEWIAAGDIPSVESAWLEALGEKAPTPDLVAVVEALAAAGRAETAETLAWMFLEERTDLAPPEVLEAAKALLSALPNSTELRRRCAELCRTVHGSRENFEAILNASGLVGTQSPRRALRTLELCLNLPAGTYLVGRYDLRVLRVGGFDAVVGQFELADSAGRRVLLELKLLADEYEPIEERDFRVVLQFRPQEMKALLEADPAAALVGLCLSRGGRIGANDIKDALVGRFLTADDWGGWWGRARTAAKRCPQLSLEGRAPIVVRYHAGGRTLEEEMAGAEKAARSPLELHAVLGQYLREVKTRKLTVNAGFAGGLAESLAREAQSFLNRRPADSLAAALALEAAVRAGVPAPKGPHPSPADVFASVEKPEELLAALEEEALWLAGLEALCNMPGAIGAGTAGGPARWAETPVAPAAAGALERLLEKTPSRRLDALAERLRKVGGAVSTSSVSPDVRENAIADEVGSGATPFAAGEAALTKAAADAVSDPMAHLELFVWLWQGPAQAPSGVPGPVEMLSRLLKALGDLNRRWDLAPADRKELWQRVRLALSAGDFAAFRRASAAMDEHVAATVKRQVERLEGLAQAVREGMLQELRERFPALFYTRETVPPWAMEGTIWTTEASLHRREAEYKDLVDVKMLANARAIGAAAAHGDLSENSEWKFAIEERDMLRARALKMQEELAQARVLEPREVPADSVGIGSRVHLKRLRDGADVTLTFLGPWDADPDQGIYSYQTRMGLDLMGRAPGEEVVLKIEGEEEPYRIERVASALG